MSKIRVAEVMFDEDLNYPLIIVCYVQLGKKTLGGLQSAIW